MKKNRFSIVISGSTGTGKTDAALKLSEKLPIEIINADIGSFYTDMTIGTAKPDWKSEKTPHHFFDVIDGCYSWTAPQFRSRLEILLQEIWQRGNIPVIVGGSAFYIESFFFMTDTIPNADPSLIEELEKLSLDELWQKLSTVDSKRAEKIGRNDAYRLVRALAIWHTTGEKPSDFTRIYKPLSPFIFVTIQRNRQELYEKINKRTHSMIEQGWVEEVAQLVQDPAWKHFIMKKKMIGYDVLVDFLQSSKTNQDLNNSVTVIQKKTRNYAKRQITFLKKLQRVISHHLNEDNSGCDVIEWNLTLCDLSLYIKQLSERIFKLLE